MTSRRLTAAHFIRADFFISDINPQQRIFHTLKCARSLFSGRLWLEFVGGRLSD